MRSLPLLGSVLALVSFPLASCSQAQENLGDDSSASSELLVEGAKLCGFYLLSPDMGQRGMMDGGWREVPAPSAAADLRGEGWAFYEKRNAEVETSPIDYVHMQGRRCAVNIQGASVDFSWLRERDGFSEGRHVVIDDGVVFAELLTQSRVDNGLVTTIRAQRQNIGPESTRISISRFEILNAVDTDFDTNEGGEG